jgi:hypothetical protein
MLHPYGKSAIALFLFTACALNFSAPLFANTPASQPQKEEKPSPWLTGPLLTPAGHVIPDGHYNIEPYEYATTNYGAYNSKWNSHSTPKFCNINTQISMQFGLPCQLNIAANPSWSWNHTAGASHWALNDLGIGIAYQLWLFKKGGWWPATKLAVGANLPIGRYQKLNPKSKGTDIGGTGSWTPSIGVVMSHLFWWGGHIFFSPRLSVQYAFPTPVHVKNYNTYGGGHHTRGTVFPGQALLVQFGYEVSLSQNWAIAGDVQYLHLNKTRFKGHKGSTDGTPNTVGGPSSESFSLAPAIEYNWSNNYGIIAGVWFTVGGRNTLDFASGVVAFNIYH